MSAKGEDNGWDRANFNVRLTKARRDQLKAVAASLSASATPMEALDAALERALLPMDGGVGEERFDELEDHVTACAMKNESDLARWGERIDTNTKAIDDLRALISALAEADGEPQAGAAQDAPLAFRPWIARELSARGIRASREVIVRAAWRSTSAKSARLVAVGFDGTLISVDGKTARFAATGLAGIRLEIDPSNELAGAWRVGALALRCVAQGSGWKLHAHAISLDGSPGRLVATLDA